MVFSGAELDQMELERPFAEGASGSLPVVVDREMKQNFGTGIHSVSPAHNIEDLKTSYKCNLPRSGCIDPATGFLNTPLALAGTDITQEKDTVKAIKSMLSD